MITVLRWRQAEPPLKLRWRGPDAQTVDALAQRPMMPLAAYIGMPGATGPQGALGSSGESGSSYTSINGEIPTGNVDGVNVIFALANLPVFLILWLDGVRLQPGLGFDYTRNAAQIVMLSVPQAGQLLSADYLYGG